MTPEEQIKLLEQRVVKLEQLVQGSRKALEESRPLTTFPAYDCRTMLHYQPNVGLRQMGFPWSFHVWDLRLGTKKQFNAKRVDFKGHSRSMTPQEGAPMHVVEALGVVKELSVGFFEVDTRKAGVHA